MTTNEDLAKRPDESPRQHLARLDALRTAAETSGDEHERWRINCEMVDFGWDYFVWRVLDDDDGSDESED